MNVHEIRGQKGLEQMFDYNTPHATALREYFLSAHRDGDTIEFGGFEFATTATLADGTNVIRALLVIADSVTADEFERFGVDTACALDLGYITSPFPVIAEEYAIATFSTEFVENEDGSVHVATVTATVATATDTATVTTRHADGTVTVSRQNADDVHATIRNGHRVLMAQFVDGVINDYADDVAEETVTENPKH
jgi:hypothetical protein